jgi:hypothetical protein
MKKQPGKAFDARIPPVPRPAPSCKDVLYDLAAELAQLLVTASVEIGEPVVIQSE